MPLISIIISSMNHISATNVNHAAYDNAYISTVYYCGRSALWHVNTYFIIFVSILGIMQLMWNGVTNGSSFVSNGGLHCQYARN